MEEGEFSSCVAVVSPPVAGWRAVDEDGGEDAEVNELLEPLDVVLAEVELVQSGASAMAVHKDYIRIPPAVVDS